MLRIYLPSLSRNGKFLIAKAIDSEFVFSDGCLNNFRSGGIAYPFRARCVVPLTPDIAAIYDSPRSYSSNDTILSVALEPDEVNAINRMTMIYGEKYIFYRKHKPADLTELQIGSHKELVDHETPWLAALLFALAQASWPR